MWGREAPEDLRRVSKVEKFWAYPTPPGVGTVLLVRIPLGRDSYGVPKEARVLRARMKPVASRRTTRQEKPRALALEAVVPHAQDTPIHDASTIPSHTRRARTGSDDPERLGLHERGW